MLLTTNLMVLTSEEGLSRLFGLDFQLLADAVLTLIAIFFLCFIFSFFLFKPVRKILEDRSEKIKNELDSAASDMEEARALREEYESKMKNVDKEAQAILDDARKRGMDNETRIISEAKEEAGRIIERARTEAELEKKKMADDVKREIITVASAMAGKVVAASINTKVQDDLIDSTLKEIGEGTWLSE